LSAFNPSNYRGIHLTSILSKIAERVIGRSLVPFLQTRAFGPCQWAFSRGLSARDLVTALMMSWILAICTGHKIASYLSDISGAFDRVFRDYMCAKLYAAGVDSRFLNFLLSYLEPRHAAVVAEDVKSDEFEISNQVIQGTVLGPPLWNTFFSDVTIAASNTGGGNRPCSRTTSVYFRNSIDAFRMKNV